MSDYGSVEKVATHSSLWTLGGVFLDADIYQPGTNPPLTDVEGWLDDVCHEMNMALKQAWFVTPISEITSPDSFGLVSNIVNSLVTDLVYARNDKGRFFTETALQSKLSRWAQIQKDVQNFVSARADGFVADNVQQIPHNDAKAQIRVMMLGNH